jgi:hypothetical protein
MKTSMCRLFSLLLIGSLMMAACNFGSSTSNVDLQQQITQTMQAVGTSAQDTLQAAVPTTAVATDTPVPTDTPTMTSTPLPSETPAPTETPKPTNTLKPVVVIYNTNTPVPTVSSDPVFSLEYYRMEECDPNWVPAIKIVNKSSKDIHSYSVVIKDRDKATTTTAASNDFSKRSGCSVSKDIPSVGTGDTGYIYGANLDYDPSDHSMKATVTVCFHDDMNGHCSTQFINFKP